jgi:hypothetical protein
MSTRTSDNERSGESVQDTPGRPKSSSSRQQTQPKQGGNTGNPEIDRQADARPPQSEDVRNEK